MMKDPFEFTRKWINRWLTPQVGERDAEMDRLTEELPGLRELEYELQDEYEMGKVLQKMQAYDVEKALQRVTSPRRKPTHMIYAAAAVGLLLVGTLFFFLWEKDGEVFAPELAVSQAPTPRVVLKTGEGIYHLDTLTDPGILNQSGMVFSQREGVLVMEEALLPVDKIEESDWAEIIVPFGTTYSLILQDGTQAWLNSGSSLKFPRVFHVAERRIKMAGEIYLEVKPDQQRPFVVEMEMLSVKVLGTSFNVKSYPNEDQVTTTLVSGAVALLREDNPDVLLAPGEQAVFERDINQMRVQTVNTESVISWKDGIFTFDDMALEEILLIISRWYDLEVEYRNDQVKSEIFTGKVPMYEEVKDALRKFELSGIVRFEIKERRLIVDKK